MTESPQNHDAEPPTLNHCIGQRRAVQQFKTAIEAVVNDRGAAPQGSDLPVMGHVLLVGPPGVGKSTLSSIIARELGSTCHEELGQNIESPAQLQGFLMLADPGDVIFVDEVHELPSLVQTTLYRALEERKLFLQAGRGGKRNAITLPPFTFIGATTDEYRIAKPMRDRIKLVARLTYYSDDELRQLLIQRTKRIGWQIADDAIADLGARGRGTPRLAIRLLEAARRACRASGSDVITLEHVRRMTEEEGVDALGLDELEQRYLSILAESASPIRLNVIATMLGLPRRTIEMIESDLLRLGLISKEDDGRMITPRGREHRARTTTVST